VTSGTPPGTFNFEEGSFLNYMLAPADREAKAEAELGLVTDVTGTCTVTAGAVTVALDSGATTSCFKEGSEFRVLSQPITVRGALPGLTSVARGTTELPCPALPSGTLRGLHSPNFRHNLVSLEISRRKGWKCCSLQVPRRRCAWTQRQGRYCGGSSGAHRVCMRPEF